MKQYKTIAGPIGLKAQTGQDYEDAVKQYARIIDNEAVGGWALHLIQQIYVRKLIYVTVIIGAAIGAVLGAVLGANMFYDIGGAGGFFLGLLLGAGLGCLGLKYKDVFFNMLVFVKDDAVSFKSGVPGVAVGSDENPRSTLNHYASIPEERSISEEQRAEVACTIEEQKAEERMTNEEKEAADRAIRKEKGIDEQVYQSLLDRIDNVKAKKDLNEYLALLADLESLGDDYIVLLTELRVWANNAM